MGLQIGSNVYNSMRVIDKKFIVIVLLIATIISGIIGVTCVSVSDCRSRSSLFCKDDSEFIAGYVFLMLMIICLLNTVLVYWITDEHNNPIISLLIVNWIVVCAIIGGTLIGVSECALKGQTFCKHDPLFITGFSFLIIMAFTICVLIIFGCVMYNSRRV